MSIKYDTINLNLDNLVYHYWKDLNFRYVNCNQGVINAAGMSAFSDIYNKSDDEFCWKNHADEYRESDKKIYDGMTLYQKKESITYTDGRTADMLVTKKPWFDAKGKLIGLLGCSIVLIDFIEDHTKEKLPISYMQRKCLIRLVKGMSAKQIARDLGLSPRTVESYINIIKHKFNCHTKYEIIKKALTFDSIIFELAKL